MNIQKRNSIGFLAMIVIMVGSMVFAPMQTQAATYYDPDVPVIDVELQVRFTKPESMSLAEISTPFTLKDTNIDPISMLAEVGDYEDVKAETLMLQGTTVTYSSSWSFTVPPSESMALAGATPSGNFQTLSGVDESSLDYWDNKIDTQFRSWTQDKDVRELLTEAAVGYNNSWDWSDYAGI